MVFGRDPGDITKELRCEYKERFESVRRWQSNLASKSVHTFYEYLGDLIRFCQAVDMTPDELIRLRAETLRSEDPVIQHRIEEMVQGYVNKYAMEKSVSKAKCIRNAVGSFFRHNYYRLGTISISAVEEEEEPIKAIKTEDLREVLKRCIVRERSIILTILSGGFREGTFVQLRLLNINQDDLEFTFDGDRIRDVKINRTPVHVHAPKRTNKGKRNSYDTFITAEAAKELVKRLKERIGYGERLTLKSYVYINAKRLKKTGLKLKPLSIYMLMRRAGKRAGLKLNPSDLRDYFSSKLERAKVPFSAIEQMMGHLAYYSTSAGSYKKFSVEELREFYSEAEAVLTIETVLPTKERKMESEIDELRSEVAMLRNVLGRLISELPQQETAEHIKALMEEKSKEEALEELGELRRRSETRLKLPRK